MNPVILESPFSSPDQGQFELNIRYAQAAMRDSLMRGEAPFASHLLYTQEGILDDTVHHERTLGIEAGFAWGALARKTVVYNDLGISPGMQQGINIAFNRGSIVEYRFLPPDVLERVKNG